MLLLAKHLPVVKEVLTWTAPAVLIPSLRYSQDSQEQRKELFLRDASTYSFGAILFLSMGLLGRNLMRRHKVFNTQEARDFVAFLIALGGNILYAGIGAPRLSKSLSKRNSDGLSPPPVYSKPEPFIRPPHFAEFRRVEYLA